MAPGSAGVSPATRWGRRDAGAPRTTFCRPWIRRRDIHSWVATCATIKCGEARYRSVWRKRANMSDDGTISFGRQLLRQRRRAGLTQERLAQLAGVGLRTLRDIEAGATTYPQV